MTPVKVTLSLVWLTTLAAASARLWCVQGQIYRPVDLGVEIPEVEVDAGCYGGLAFLLDRGRRTTYTQLCPILSCSPG